ELIEIDSEAFVGQLVGGLARGQGDDRGSERVEIDGRTGVAVELLRGHVAEGPDHRGPAFEPRRDPYAAKVDEVHAIAPIDDDVGRLDVAVDDRRRACVQVLEDV